MAIPRNIKQYLFHHNVKYSHKTHPEAYTSQQIAQVDHIPGEQFAKTVVLNTERGTIIAVIPADRVVCMDTLKKHIGCTQLALASETEFGSKFPDCQPGAMPPFGRLFALPVYCDSALSKQSEIEFNAGTHVDTVRMTFADFNTLENPAVFGFSEKRTGQPVLRSA
jgi:Ala-tRNA(Pro) deacylase